jgi:hypothetical protein
MKCEECGLESNREDIFCLGRRSFGTKKRTLCRGCFEKGAAIQAWVFTSTVLHELGHVFAARLAGLRVFGIEVGMGSLAFDFRLWGFRWQFRSIPFGGCAHAAHHDARRFRLKETLLILGGFFLGKAP